MIYVNYVDNVRLYSLQSHALTYPPSRFWSDTRENTFSTWGKKGLEEAAQSCLVVGHAVSEHLKTSNLLEHMQKLYISTAHISLELKSYLLNQSIIQSLGK